MAIHNLNILGDEKQTNKLIRIYMYKYINILPIFPEMARFLINNESKGLDIFLKQGGRL